VGATLTVSGGGYLTGAVTAVQFERCGHSCVTVARGRSGSLTVTAGDAGYYMRALVTVSGPGGSVRTWASGAIGPIRSTRAGAATLQSGSGTIRGSAGRPLAQVSTTTKRASVRGYQASAETAGTSTVRFTRAGGVKGSLRVWACALEAGSPASCTAPLTVRRVASFELALRAGDRVEVVAVVRG
jgi:hypothetical protein